MGGGGWGGRRWVGAHASGRSDSRCLNRARSPAAAASCTCRRAPPLVSNTGPGSGREYYSDDAASYGSDCTEGIAPAERSWGGWRRRCGAGRR